MNIRNGETRKISTARYSSIIAKITGERPQNRAIKIITNTNGCPRKYGSDANNLRK
jgi:hypothetical protein